MRVLHGPARSPSINLIEELCVSTIREICKYGKQLDARSALTNEIVSCWNSVERNSV